MTNTQMEYRRNQLQFTNVHAKTLADMPPMHHLKQQNCLEHIFMHFQCVELKFSIDVGFQNLLQKSHVMACI